MCIRDRPNGGQDIRWAAAVVAAHFFRCPSGDPQGGAPPARMGSGYAAADRVIEQHRDAAVSYTHLDVYKRQIRPRRSRIIAAIRNSQGKTAMTMAKGMLNSSRATKITGIKKRHSSESVKSLIIEDPSLCFTVLSYHAILKNSPMFGLKKDKNGGGPWGPPLPCVI